MTEVTFLPGQTIVREGERGSTAFVIKSGRVEIARASGDKKRVLAQLGPGGVVGEMALIDDQPRMASATALSNSVCTVVSRDAFNRAIANSPPLARYLLNTFVRNIRVSSGVPLSQTGAGSVQSGAMRSLLPELQAEIHADRATAKLMERRHFPVDTAIFRQGSQGASAFLIQTGTVEIIRTNAEGRGEILGRLMAGDVFGELALLGNLGQRNANAIVAEPATCDVISKPYFNALLSKCPLFIRALFKIYAGHLEDLSRTMNGPASAAGTEALLLAKM